MKIYIRKIQVILDIEKLRLYCLIIFEIRCIYCVFGHILIFTKSVSMFCLFLRMIKCAQNSWSLSGPEVLSVTKNNLAQVWGMYKVFYIQLNFFTTWKLHTYISPKSVLTYIQLSIPFEIHNWKLEKPFSFILANHVKLKFKKNSLMGRT